MALGRSHLAKLIFSLDRALSVDRDRRRCCGMAEKFDSIISELKRRGHLVRMHVANELTSPFDAVVGNVAILNAPNFSSPKKVSKIFFQCKIGLLKDLGYKLFVVPQGRMTEMQIKTLVDCIESLLDGKMASSVCTNLQ